MHISKNRQRARNEENYDVAGIDERELERLRQADIPEADSDIRLLAMDVAGLYIFNTDSAYGRGSHGETGTEAACICHGTYDT